MRLFVYGLLMYPEIMQALCNRAFPQRRAVLHDHVRLRVDHHDWPPVGAVVPAPGAQVHGALLDGVDEDGLQLLDAFENVAAGLYDRVPCRVALDEHESVQAQLYVGGALVAQHLGEEWNETEFRDQWYRAYRERIIPGFVNEYRQQVRSC